MIRIITFLVEWGGAVETNETVAMELLILHNKMLAADLALALSAGGSEPLQIASLAEDVVLLLMELFASQSSLATTANETSNMILFPIYDSTLLVLNVLGAPSAVV
jgi:hypothetical protein